jgi:hypothetical protein
MPKITLEKTAAAKAGDLTDRLSQFQGNALQKLHEIQKNLGTKGTNGNLRIIYTRKSDKDLQFETRNRKWWGGLYTPSEARQEKNEQALRALFHKAGNGLSTDAKEELKNALDIFFNEYPKGINNLAPLIKRFEAISENDNQQILHQPKLIGDRQSLLASQASGNQISEEKITSEDNKSILQPERVVQENARLSTIVDQEQPIENSPDSLFESRADEQSDSLVKDVIQSPEEEKFPQNKSFISEEGSNVQENFLSSSFVDNSQKIKDNQRHSFPSDIDGNQSLDRSNAFFQSSEDGDFQNNRYSRNFRDSTDFGRHQSIEIQDSYERPDINTEELRANAADALREIQSLLASSLPRDIQALARNVSSFQDTRGIQLANLRSRANEMESRFNHGDTLPSIPKYLGDLKQLNVDIKKFSEVKMSDSIWENIGGFQERIENVKDALRLNSPKDILLEELVTIFPELEDLEVLNVSLDQIENRLAESYSINEKSLNYDGIRAIYQGALHELNGAAEELSSLPNAQQLSESLDRLENDIQDLQRFSPYISYDSAEFSKDCKQLDTIYRELEDLNELREASAQQLGALLENLSENHEIYKHSLGEDLKAGLDLIYAADEEDAGQLLDFDSPLRDAASALSETRTMGERLTGLLQRKEEILARLKTVHEESVLLKKQYDQELQAKENEQRTQQLQAKQSEEAKAAKQQRIESIQGSLNTAFEVNEKLIAYESAKSLKQIEEQFPKGLGGMLLYVERVKQSSTDAVPERLVERLRKNLNAHIDNQIAKNGPVDSETRQSWQEQINSKVKDWKNRPFYLDDQKQYLGKLITGQWGVDIKTQAEGVISKIEQQKGLLQNRIAGLGRDLSFEQQNLLDEVRDLETQAADQRKEFKAIEQSLQALEDRKKTISRDESSQDSLSQEIATLQKKIIELETNLERTQASLKDKNDQLTQTFSDQYPDEVSAMRHLDEKIGLIKSSVNAIGVEFP